MPVRCLAILALAVAAHAAAAGDRFVPADPSFVVANVSSTLPDESLRPLVSAWQRDRDDATAIALANALLDRAHARREPMYIGRAEAVLAARARLAGSNATVRRLYAQTLQYRHDFQAAARLLDTVLGSNPRDVAARSLRASVRLVQGDFAGARTDCAQLIGAGGAQARIGIACLAEALAGTGELERARTLLTTLPTGGTEADAYLLAVRAELAERSGDLDGAIADYQGALALAPNDDSVRAALADALAAGGRGGEAYALLAVERPSLALRVRRALLASGAQRSELTKIAGEWLTLEASRGDARHDREAALLALGAGRPASALEYASANFAVQRELTDVRVLALAAVAARDTGAQRELRQWLDSTGFRDVVTVRILASAPDH
jgi:tetratricopeptide (TPR) repeat protein